MLDRASLQYVASGMVCLPPLPKSIFLFANFSFELAGLILLNSIKLSTKPIESANIQSPGNDKRPSLHPYCVSYHQRH